LHVTIAPTDVQLPWLSLFAYVHAPELHLRSLHDTGAPTVVQLPWLSLFAYTHAPELHLRSWHVTIAPTDVQLPWLSLFANLHDPTLTPLRVTDWQVRFLHVVMPMVVQEPLKIEN